MEADPGALAPVRLRLGRVETELWERADTTAATHDPAAIEEYVGTAWASVDTALRALDVVTHLAQQRR